jgi:hypothetical protein
LSQAGNSDKRIKMRLMNLKIDGLVLSWKIGLITAYLFLVIFILYIILQVFLIYRGFMIGDYAYIQVKFTRYLYISAGYFGIALLLRWRKIV